MHEDATCSTAARGRLLAAVLDTPEISRLVDDVTACRHTGRPGYPVRAMVAMVLARSLFGRTSWRATVQLVTHDQAMRSIVDPSGDEARIPSLSACYRFARKLRAHLGLLQATSTRLAAAARRELGGCGTTVAIETADIPAFTNGFKTCIRRGGLTQRTSHPEARSARWTDGDHHALRKQFGYHLRAVVCTTTGLPLEWQFTSAGVPAPPVERELAARLPVGSRTSPPADRLRLLLPSAFGPHHCRRCVPFGSRGMATAHLLVEASLISRLVVALVMSRKPFRATSGVPVR